VLQVHEWAVALTGCAPGFQVQGIFCQPCGAGNWSLGTGADVRLEYRSCRSCPPVGADCGNGVIALRRHFYRPQRHVDERHLLGPATELWPCWNGEACAVFNATDNVTHACSLGYSGALCGVCDADAGYGKFGEVCAPCWSRGASEAFLAGAVIAVVAVLAYFALRRSSGVKSPASIALKITLSFLQVRGAPHSVHAVVRCPHQPAHVCDHRLLAHHTLLRRTRRRWGR
jgi:hypothetical protein